MSRRQRHRPDIIPGTDSLEVTECRLKQAQQILQSGRRSFQGEEWILLASIVGEADLVIQKARRRDPTLEFPLLETVVAELREVTSDFTYPVFVRSTRATRRRYRSLFIAKA